MTVDTRCTVITDLGISLSGSLSEDHIDGSNVLAKVRGTVEFAGILNLARGTAVNAAYTVPGFAEVTRFPRRLWVLSSKVSPFDEVTTVEVGCTLTLKQDLKEPATATAASSTPAWQAALPATAQAVIPVPLYARNVLAECLSKLGIQAAAGNVPLTSSFLREELDMSGGYVQVINDLLASESCYGFINTAGQFVVRKILEPGATGPVLRREHMITMEGIEGGAPPPDQIRVVWEGAVQAPPGLQPAGIPVVPTLPSDLGAVLDLTPEQEAGIEELKAGLVISHGLSGTEVNGIINQGILDSGAVPENGVISLSPSQYDDVITNSGAAATSYVNQRQRAEDYQTGQYPPPTDPTDPNVPNEQPPPPLRNWTYEETISPPKTYIQSYEIKSGPNKGKYYQAVSFSAKSTNITTFADIQYVDAEGKVKTESVAIRRESQTTNAVGPANATRWKSKLERGSPARAGDTLIASSITTYKNVVTPEGIKVEEEETIEYMPLIAFAGKLGIQNWYGLDLGLDSIPVSRVVTKYEWDTAADVTKTTVSRWLAWGETTEGAQGAAAVAKMWERLPDAERVEATTDLVDDMQPMVFDGTEVRISVGRGSAQRRPSPQDRAREALGADAYGGSGSTGGSGSGSVGLDFSGDTSPSATGTFYLPYPADDVLEGEMVDPATLQARVVPGNVQEQARVFGQMQNYLAFGHSNGVAITTEIRNMPTEPLGAVFIEAAGVSGVFRVNGSSWAWGSEGMIVGADALLHGTAGVYDQPEFSDSWVPVPVAVEELPVLGDATVNANPQPANTIPLPEGFDPLNPGGLWGSLPTGGSDVPALARTVDRVVKPRDEKLRCRATTRSRVVVRSWDYELDLGTDQVRAESRSLVEVRELMLVDLQVATVTVATPTLAAGTVRNVRLPATTIEVQAPAVRVLKPVVAQLPVIAVSAVAPIADVGTLASAVLLPLTIITVSTPSVRVTGEGEAPYFGSWSGQNVIWTGNPVEEWWGN